MKKAILIAAALLAVTVPANADMIIIDPSSSEYMYAEPLYRIYCPHRSPYFDVTQVDMSKRDVPPHLINSPAKVIWKTRWNGDDTWEICPDKPFTPNILTRLKHHFWENIND